MLQLQQLSIFFVLPHCLCSVSLGVNVFLMTSLRIAFLFLLFRMREGSQHFTDLKKFPFSGLLRLSWFSVLTVVLMVSLSWFSKLWSLSLYFLLFLPLPFLYVIHIKQQGIAYLLKNFVSRRNWKWDIYLTSFFTLSSNRDPQSETHCLHKYWYDGRDWKGRSCICYWNIFFFFCQQHETKPGEVRKCLDKF